MRNPLARRVTGSSVRRFTPADYRVMPWKNGGGTTTELHVEPGSGPPFLWRVSIADVAVDGPFSIFTGYDRHIMAIDGSGMVLVGAPGGPIEVNPKFIPRSFSGDWPIISRLISGPVRDFNLMSRRESVESNLGCSEISTPSQLGDAGAVTFAYLLGGELDANGQLLVAGESLLLMPGEVILVKPVCSSRLAVCRIKQLD